MKRVEELNSLRLQHQRTFDPLLKSQAVQLLHTLPVLSTDEDPHFVVSLHALRAAAYFNAAQAPTTFALLNHFTRHTFLLDGNNVYRLLLSLAELRHPQTAEVLQILLPRIRQVATDDVTAVEATTILRVLHQFGVDDDEVAEALGTVMARTVSSLTSAADVRRCVAVWTYTGDAAQAKKVISAAEDHLCDMVGEGIEEQYALRASIAAELNCFAAESSSASSSSPSLAHEEVEELKQCRESVRADLLEKRELLRELCRSLTWLCWGPRRLLSELSRSALVWSEPMPTLPSAPVSTDTAGPEVTSVDVKRVVEDLQRTIPTFHRGDLGAVAKLLHHTSYRHERALRQLTSRLATSPSPIAGRISDDGPEAALADAPLPSQTLQDVANAVESLAFFYLVDAVPTVEALLAEVAAVLRRSPTSSNGRAAEAVVVVESVCRILHGVNRLYMVGLTSTSQMVINDVISLCTCAPVQQYARGAHSATDVVLTARLADALTQLSCSLDSAATRGEAGRSALSGIPLRKNDRYAVITRLLQRLAAGLRQPATLTLEVRTEAVRLGTEVVRRLRNLPEPHDESTPSLDLLKEVETQLMKAL